MTVPDQMLLAAPHSRDSALAAFAQWCRAEAGWEAASDEEFARRAETDYRTFWREFVRWSGLRTGGSLEPACTSEHVASAIFFPELTLNYAAELLRADRGDDARAAIIAVAEDGRRAELSRAALRGRVERLVTALRELGVSTGDRVVAVARNNEEAVIGALAATALGAIWSSISPDLGYEAAVARFEPLQPVLLLTHSTQQVHGALRDFGERIRTLCTALPSLRAVVLLDAAGDAVDLPLPTCTLSDLCASASPTPLEAWPLLPFNHPLFILFSSGTTGRPKCIVHGAGGTLLEHLKEHRLHGDLGADDTMLFYTTCGWMMWNWQLSALACGAAIITYDGSVSFPEQDSLLGIVDRERVTVFGTSAAYLQFCQDSGLEPRERHAFAALRAILSTGSILYERQFEWIVQAIKAVPVQSISGGTDIIGCFVLGHPHRPVYAGDSQAVTLGVAVRAWTEAGPEQEGTGDLVCIRPFPSRPIGLWGDPDGTRFREAFFDGHADVWNHGDRITLRADGRARILGRSDGTLNVRGVRIGPAEIHAVVADLPEIADALAVEQRDQRETGGARMVLLVVLRPDVVLDRQLQFRIKRALKDRASANHVPAVIADVPALPVTYNGKVSARAARDALNGDPVVNISALRNPEVLSAIAGHPAARLT